MKWRDLTTAQREQVTDLAPFWWVLITMGCAFVGIFWRPALVAAVACFLVPVAGLFLWGLIVLTKHTVELINDIRRDRK